ncbi:hypothetical protein EV699_10127 [Plasticicumulans lactativorans]|uniref:Periplakin-like plectin repeat domain-containing protein n=1 Tax=Plasticicumulans lactativorans TaxID=1133106 RepID=A0A4R2LK47_9GAMM|nr:hypothetical protein [Plasticicumulans lactativorans]TCO83643.1 hypothetical protein EV699_10127 [Plasticicumulans lactativorans]
MDTNTLVWLASGGTLAGIVSVITALVCGMHYGAALRRIPAAAFLEDIVARVATRREELERLDAQLGERHNGLQGLRGETEMLTARRDALAAQLRELQEDLVALDGRRADIASVRDELAEARTQLAMLVSELTERRTQQEQLERAAERARAQLSLLEERRSEIEAIDTAEREARIRLTEAQTELGTVVQAREAARREAEAAARDREMLATNIDRLTDERNELRADIASLQAERNPLSTEVQGLRRHLEQLHLQQQALDGDLQRLQSLQPVLEDKISGLQQEVVTRTAELKDLQAERDPLSTEVQGLRRHLEQLHLQRQTLDGDLQRLQSLQPVLEDKISGLQQEVVTRTAELKDLQAERDPLAADIDGLRRQLEPLRTQCDEVEAELARRRAELAAIEQEIRTKGGGSVGNPEDVLADLEQAPACLVGDGGRGPLMPNPQRDDDETAMLGRVRTHLDRLRLHFPERTLYAFHTALKTATISPLTVLAGISGTGKSQLPRRYAEAMGIHFLKLPVQPRWDSPQDMLGFYNYLEKRYKATEFARALVHFDTYNWPLARPFKDRLLLILLDELNLARVEYYFSEFLSQLEGRPAPGDRDPEHIRSSEIVLDTGGVGGPPPRIYPGHNLLFVGTMNEDESTQTLSDKVLDRANLLRFPRPEKLAGETLASGGEPAEGFLPASRWHAWRRSFGTLPATLREPVERWIHDLNEHLDGLHRPFAHRVNQAMLAYIANYPGVAEPMAQTSPLDQARIAFADQLEQRILPKLRGIDLGDSGVTQHLDRIRALIDNELHDATLARAFQRAAQDDGSGRPFVWKGVRRESI